jgi:phosphate transport system substrate-binding protein
MRRYRQPLTLSLLAVAVVALATTAGCSYSEEGNAKEAPITGSNTRTLGAAGSTFIAPLMARWASSYEQAHPVHVNYRPIGSGGGIDEIKEGRLEFAASDAPLSDDQLKDMPALVQVPATAGPVCIIYNLPNLNAPLRLSAKTLAGIYSGSIISWQDPAIAKDNPGVKLPKAAVIVVHRSDGSGTTNILTNYLSKVSQDWSWKSGHGLSVTWPIGLGAEGSKGVLALVKQTPGTIGYLELSYAKEKSVPVASIQNQAGQFVAPSPESTAAAIAASSDALARDVRTPIVDPPASAKDAYPISGLSFILIRKAPDSDDQRAVRDFIAYAISTGQASAEELSYAKLPASVQQQGQQLLSQLSTAGQQAK